MDNRYYFSINWACYIKVKVKHASNFRSQRTIVPCLRSRYFRRFSVKFFKKNKIKNFKVWDDSYKKLYQKHRAKNLNQVMKQVDYIVLSPGISLVKNKNLIKFKKIITDIDLFF